jgi:hypothetical protein
MVRTHSLLFPALVVLMVAPAAMSAASCGSPDATAPDTGGVDAGRRDGPSLDGPGPDGPMSDGTMTDGGVIDGAATDGDEAASLDGSDAAAAFDGQLVNAPFVTSILGSADRFAVFSGGTVENARGTTTTITGDLGTYPGNTAVGLTPPVVVGTQHLGDEVAQGAASDVAIAYGRLSASNLPCGTDLTGLDLGGMRLVPGVYCFSSTAALTGTLTLDAQKNADAVWVFQVGSALTTASDSQVVVINGTPAQMCNVFWQITSAATLGTNSVFGGNVLAYAAVTVTAGTSVVGRTFALTAKVSMDTNTVSIATCPLSAPALDGGLSGADAGDAF